MYTHYCFDFYWNNCHFTNISHHLHFVPCPFLLMSRTKKCSKVNAWLWKNEFVGGHFLYLLPGKCGCHHLPDEHGLVLVAQLDPRVASGPMSAVCSGAGAVPEPCRELWGLCPFLTLPTLWELPLKARMSLWGEVSRVCTKVCTFKVTVRDRLSFLVTGAHSVISNVTCLCVQTHVPVWESTFHPYFWKRWDRVTERGECSLSLLKRF